MDKNLLKLYAAFAVRSGVNLQKNQTLIINCPIETAEFGRMCAAEAFEAGARDVVVHYKDEQLSRIRMAGALPEALEDVKPWRLRSYLDYLDGEGGACSISIAAADPEIYKGLDTARIERANRANSRAMQPYTDRMMASESQWCVLAVPTAAWAAKVFPGTPPEAAVEKLWQAIFETARVAGGNPVAEWEKLAADTSARLSALNSMELDALRLQNDAGTNLTVGLADGHIFQGIQEHTQGGVPFLANIPSEEVFTAPHCRRVDGVVKSSLPYVYNGNLIEGITATFQDGLVVQASAEKGDALLQQLLSADAGARRLGEIALVPASSPIRKTGLLFYNTLFDENAACHIAFGAGYPTCVRGGREMTRPQLLEKGVNDSVIHEDVMIGTPDMQITGIRRNGQTVPIFVNGEWAGS